MERAHTEGCALADNRVFELRAEERALAYDRIRSDFDVSDIRPCKRVVAYRKNLFDVSYVSEFYGVVERVRADL